MICQPCGQREHHNCYDRVHNTAYLSCPCQCRPARTPASTGSIAPGPSGVGTVDVAGDESPASQPVSS